MGGEKLRIGSGYDVHRLVKGRRLVLGGVDIPYEKGLLGHSDADVLLHAICDALLGAAALGDIGRHFPDTNHKYKDIDSLILLQQVGLMLQQQGWAIINLDSIIVAQQPKLAAYIPTMISRIAAALDIEPGRINVKATTTEGLGFEGQGEGISAQAVVLIEGKANNDPQYEEENK
jgi:2-C-methyl-D-erythritol 2,4-cyclodiphosphate synthase